MAKLNTKESVVDLLKSQGKDSSFDARKTLAEEAGIKNYTGSYDQNVALYGYVSNGGSSSSSNSNNSNSTPRLTLVNQTSAARTYPVAPSSSNKNTPKVNGADSSLVDTATSTFTPSDSYNDANKQAEASRDRVNELTSVDGIVSQETWDTINSTFVVPNAVIEADRWLGSQLSKIQSGKTSYSDDVRAMVEKIQNREKFSYDVDNDQLFQQALASAMGSGKQAMQDTIGQASALTGGYGSTYATSAGNQAYNAFIEDAYNNLPQYYQMAFDAYQAEGQDMYQQLSMLSTEDAKEYERMLTAYDATYAHRNQMYNEAYTTFRDTKSDAFASANLQINEHGQLVSDAVNAYNVNANYADTIYAQEWDKWQSEVDSALTMIGYQNNDYWNQQDMDYKNATLEEDKRQYNLDYEQSEQFHEEEMGYKYATFNYEKERDSKEDNQYIAANDWNGDKVVDVNDAKAAEEWKAQYTGNTSSKNYATVILEDGTSADVDVDALKPYVDELKQYSSNDQRLTYIANLEASGILPPGGAEYLTDVYGVPDVALDERKWVMTFDGGKNGKGGIDEDARVKDQFGNEYRLDSLYEKLVEIYLGQTGQDKAKAEEKAKNYILKLQGNLGITKD